MLENKFDRRLALRVSHLLYVTERGGKIRLNGELS